jgi:hypothetical protein
MEKPRSLMNKKSGIFEDLHFNHTPFMLGLRNKATDFGIFRRPKKNIPLPKYAFLRSKLNSKHKANS